MKHLIIVITFLLMILSSCSGEKTRPVHQELNSVYYWKTVFHLDSADMSFIKKHDIGRIYLRMFDVTKDAYAPYISEIEEMTEPNATVRISQEDYRLLRDSLRDKEFVPVVYITLDALKIMEGNERVLASNIVERVRNMCEYNDLPNVRELQLDCDWTETTEKSFFDLCYSVKQSIADMQLPWRLSSTIRLHQLSRDVPPVDNGVLMVYNTGSYADPDTENSIIDKKDIIPYLKHLSDYRLHLDVAYPIYSWQLLFRKRIFIGLVKGLSLSDTTLFARRSQTEYVAKRDIPYNGRTILKGDILRQESSEYKNILSVKRLIAKELSDCPHSNILYHFDSNNFSTYSGNEIDQLLSTAE